MRVYIAGDERLAVIQDGGKFYAQADDGARSQIFSVGNDEFRFRTIILHDDVRA